MLVRNGDNMLKEFSSRSHQKEWKQITDRIHFFTGYGHSNVIAVEGEKSLILIDSLESPVRAERLKQNLYEKTGKEVETLIYTHGHPDHRGGSGAFRHTARRIIAARPVMLPYERSEMISAVLQQRTARQFGYELTEEELITQGLGIREGHCCEEGSYDILLPTEWLEKNRESYTIDGISFELIAAPGETDDQMYVWFPEEQVLCCGDNYYQCWPNLSAVRGGQYRDVAAWVRSLEQILDLHPCFLLPGHMKAIAGWEEIEEIIGNYRRAIESILVQTLDCINRGMSESQTVCTVELPAELRDIPYLGEFYGTVSWSVRSVYHGYLGWFDGNPTHLNSLPDSERARRLIALAGGGERVLEEAVHAAGKGDFQWSAELCDYLIDAGMMQEKARRQKAAGLLKLADFETSANGRHYYISCAHDII